MMSEMVCVSLHETVSEECVLVLLQVLLQLLRSGCQITNSHKLG